MHRLQEYTINVGKFIEDGYRLKLSSHVGDQSYLS